MRVVIQRVNHASVQINNELYNSIGLGLLVLIGIENNDDINDIKWIANKIKGLRIFPDENGVMNLSLLEVEADILLISQFTLFASTKKGNRPSYIRSAKADISIPLYEQFKKVLSDEIRPQTLKSGEFGADMKVLLENDGPVTIIIDSKLKE